MLVIPHQSPLDDLPAPDCIHGGHVWIIADRRVGTRVRYGGCQWQCETHLADPSQDAPFFRPEGAPTNQPRATP